MCLFEYLHIFGWIGLDACGDVLHVGMFFIFAHVLSRQSIRALIIPTLSFDPRPSYLRRKNPWSEIHGFRADGLNIAVLYQRECT